MKLRKKMATTFLVLASISAITLTVFASPNTPNQYISKAQAKAIALKHAGLKEQDVKFVNGYISYDDGRAEYEIEFHKGNKEYDYEIDALTGKILDYDHDIESFSISHAKPENSTYITKAKAKAIALQHAGLKEQDVKFINGYISYDDGRAEYEIEFHKGNKEYDYEIDALTGKILDYDHDIESFSISHAKPENSTYITKAKAKAIALQHAGLKEQDVKFINGYISYDDGRAEYEIEFHKGNVEYEYQIDAVTGTILEHEMDYED